MADRTEDGGVEIERRVSLTSRVPRIQHSHFEGMSTDRHWSLFRVFHEDIATVKQSGISDNNNSLGDTYHAP